MIVEQFYILDHYSKKNFKKINNIIENLLDLVGGANVTYVKEYPKNTYISTVDELCKQNVGNMWTYCEPELKEYIKAIKGDIKWLKLKLNMSHIKRRFKSIDDYKSLENAYFLFRVDKSKDRNISFLNNESIYIIVPSPEWESKNKNAYIVHEFLNYKLEPIRIKPPTLPFKFKKLELINPKLKDVDLADVGKYKISFDKAKKIVGPALVTFKKLFNIENQIVDEPIIKKSIPITYTLPEKSVVSPRRKLNISPNKLREKLQLNILPYDKTWIVNDNFYIKDGVKIEIPLDYTNKYLNDQEFIILDKKFNLSKLLYKNNSILLLNKKTKTYLSKIYKNSDKVINPIVDLEGIIIYPYSNNKILFIYNPKLTTVYLYLLDDNKIIKEFENIQYFADKNYINYTIDELIKNKSIDKIDLLKLQETIKDIEYGLNNKIGDMSNILKTLSL